MGTQLSQPNKEWNKSLFTIILCAGEGVRLQELTQNTPKPLIKIPALNNKPIVQFTIDLLINLSVKKIAIVKGYLAKKIDEFIARLKRYNAEINNILYVVDATDEYKLGPLYSFLSFTKNKQLYQDRYVYLIIPGDTIFQHHLLNEIFSFIEDNLSVIKKKPLIFYRKIQKTFFQKGIQSKIISVADIENEEMQNFLKRIKKINLSEITSSETVNQIVPIFLFPYDFIQEIISAEKKKSVKTIREIVNYMVKQGKRIIAVEISKKYMFYDIDSKLDLIELENL